MDWLTGIAITISVLLVVAMTAALVLGTRSDANALSLSELNRLAKLGAAQANDRGTNAVTTYYTWRADQWNQLAKGLGAAAAALLVAIVPLLVQTTATVRTYTSALPGTSAPTPVPLPANPSPTNVKTTDSGSQVSASLWIALADLTLVAVFASVYARREQRAFAHDLAYLGSKS